MGPGDSTLSFIILGPHAEGIRGDKGDLFLAFCLENELRLLNTIFEDPAGTYTCNHDYKKEPTQIDFMATNINKRKVKYCRTFQSAATVTDHKGLDHELHHEAGEKEALLGS